jgi:hypothetical protein
MGVVAQRGHKGERRADQHSAVACVSPQGHHSRHFNYFLAALQHLLPHLQPVRRKAPHR